MSAGIALGERKEAPSTETNGITAASLYGCRLCLCAKRMMVKPVLQALLVADKVYEDRGTGKKIIAGVFHRLAFARQSPTQEIQTEEGKKTLVPGGLQAGSPFAYISVTEVHGQQPFVLRYVNLRNDRIFFETQFVVECKSPLDTAEIIAPLPPLPITDESTTCALELVCNDEVIGSFRIKVDEIEIQGDSDVQD